MEDSDIVQKLVFRERRLQMKLVMLRRPPAFTFPGNAIPRFRLLSKRYLGLIVPRKAVECESEAITA